MDDEVEDVAAAISETRITGGITVPHPLTAALDWGLGRAASRRAMATKYSYEIVVWTQDAHNHSGVKYQSIEQTQLVCHNDAHERSKKKVNVSPKLTPRLIRKTCLS